MLFNNIDMFRLEHRKIVSICKTLSDSYIRKYSKTCKRCYNRRYNTERIGRKDPYLFH